MEKLNLSKYTPEEVIEALNRAGYRVEKYYNKATITFPEKRQREEEEELKVKYGIDPETGEYKPLKENVSKFPDYIPRKKLTLISIH